MSKLDARFGQETLERVDRWFAKRWKHDTSGARKTAVARETLSGWKRVGLNVYELRHRMNPAFPTEPELRAAFQSIIDNGAGFTRRDLADDLVDNAGMTKASAKRMTDTVCDALVEAAVLQSEPRGLLCLKH